MQRRRRRKIRELMCRDLPGIMYVNDRRADSICETWLEFFVMKPSYIASHFGGRARAVRTLERGGDHLVFVCAASAGVDMLGNTRGVLVFLD